MVLVSAWVDHISHLIFHSDTATDIQQRSLLSPSPSSLHTLSLSWFSFLLQPFLILNQICLAVHHTTFKGFARIHSENLIESIQFGYLWTFAWIIQVPCRIVFSVVGRFQSVDGGAGCPAAGFCLCLVSSLRRWMLRGLLFLLELRRARLRCCKTGCYDAGLCLIGFGNMCLNQLLM